MARIFISHSSKDGKQAEMLMAWLKEAKYEPFLDSDKELGLSAGGDWNEQLKIRLEECRVLIPICSHNFRASDWCRYEADIAYHRGKDIIPVLIDDSEPIRILSGLQAIFGCFSI